MITGDYGARGVKNDYGEGIVVALSRVRVCRVSSNKSRN